MRLPDNAVLMIIDVQKAFDNSRWGERNNADAEKNIASLIEAWRSKSLPIIHIHHRNLEKGSLFNPGSPGVEVKPEAAPKPGEPVLFKDVNSAFIGTDLQARLQAANAKTLVFAGMTTDHCVATTARMAGNYGFDAYVVSDATATFERKEPDGKHFNAQQMHDTALASLRGEFATIVSTRDVLDAVEEVEESANADSGSDESVAAKFRNYTQRILSNVTGDPVELQTATPSRLESLIQEVPRESLMIRPSPGRWSVSEILAHLADGEAVAGYRLRKILGEPGSPIQAFDQDCWAANMNYAQREPNDSVKEFRAMREVNLALLKRLTEEQWDRYGIHTERGRESVRHFVRLYAGHDLNHLKQIEEIVKQAKEGQAASMAS
jgi:nicotinamidase-related amidase